jgi:xanthine dehydrogenase accessory factor
MKQILEEAAAVLRSGGSVALSTIVSGSGSVPMSRRSKMLVHPDGRMAGTVGGGCLEAEVYDAARAALEGGPGAVGLKRFVLTEDQAGAEGLNCGGTVEILTEKLSPGPVLAVLEGCIGVLERRVEAVMMTSLAGPGNGAPGKLVVEAGGVRLGGLGDGAVDGEAARRAEELLGSDAIALEEVRGGGRVFFESLPVTPRLVLYGGGHVSRETARVAAGTGFHVVVTDDRPAFAAPARHPDAHETKVISFDRAAEEVEIDGHTSLVVVTRGHRHDETIVRQILRSPAAYIGMIGSARKVAIMKKSLAAGGFADDEIDRVHAPVGIDIGADNPAEIAVSIVAELIAVRRRGSHRESMRHTRAAARSRQP